MSTKVSATDAKARFSECIRVVEGGDSVLITKHGKAVVVMVPAVDFAELKRLRAAGPDAGLASLEGGWEDSDELVEILANGSRSSSRSIRNLDSDWDD